MNNEQKPVIARFDGVDMLRGISILAVVLLHTAIRMNSVGFSLRAMMPPWLFHLLFRNGNNGVTVFFAVSGFLITLTSLRRFGSLAKMQPRRFYRIRFARIAPLLLLILAILSVLHLLQANGFHIPPQKATLPRALLAALSFHLNWLEAVRGYLPANWDVLWSLSVEEMFYLFFPLVSLLLFRFRRGTTLLIGVLFIFVFMGPFARVVWTTNPIWQEKSYLGGMDGIALGCLSALLTDRVLRSKETQWRSFLLVSLIPLEVIGAGMMLLVAVWPPWHWMNLLDRSGLDETVLALGTCFMIIATVLRGSGGSQWTAPIRWFGRNSYEVYMTHEFVVVWGTLLHTKLRGGPLPLWVIAIVLVSAPVGALVARYFSEPLNLKLRGVTKPSFSVGSHLLLTPAD